MSKMDNIDLINYSKDLDGFEKEDKLDELTCPICFIELNNSPYAMIDNTSEKGRYHVECIELWLNRSRNGILTQDKIKGYTIYHEDTKIESIKVAPLMPQRQVRIIDNEPDCCFCIII